MNWFDALLGVLFLALIVWEMNQEAGRGLLDCFAALAASQLCLPAATFVSAGLHWRPLPGTEAAPLAQALCFGGLFGLGLLASRSVHRQVRWTMDQFDPLCGVVFAMLIFVVVGHTSTQVVAGMALQKQGEVPQYLSSSVFGEELRCFRTYHHVVSVFEGYQEGRQ